MKVLYLIYMNRDKKDDLFWLRTCNMYFVCILWRLSTSLSLLEPRFLTVSLFKRPKRKTKYMGFEPRSLRLSVSGFFFFFLFSGFFSDDRDRFPGHHFSSGDGTHSYYLQFNLWIRTKMKMDLHCSDPGEGTISSSLFGSILSSKFTLGLRVLFYTLTGPNCLNE